MMLESSIAGIFVPIFPFITLYLTGCAAAMFILNALQHQELSRKRRIKEFLLASGALVTLGFAFLPINMEIMKYLTVKEGGIYVPLRLINDPSNW